MPVYDYQKRLSPYSLRCRKRLMEFYGTEDLSVAWNYGWRWCLQLNNHQWYPPQWAYDANLVADDDVRNRANGGSVSSTVGIKVIDKMDEYREKDRKKQLMIKKGKKEMMKTR